MITTNFILYKILVSAGIIFLYCLLYFITNKYSLYTPICLPEYKIDQHFPFVPWMVIFYVSFYVQIVLGLLLAPNIDIYHKMCCAYLISIIFFSLVYVFFPTHFRGKIEDKGCIYTKAVFLIRKIDNPVNCLPSSHVTLSMIIGVVYLCCGCMKLFAFFSIWGIGVSVSVLAVKQHSILDLLAGILLSILAGFLGSVI